MSEVGSAEAKTVRRLESKVSFMDQKSAQNAVVNSHSVPAKIRINVKLQQRAPSELELERKPAVPK